MTLSSGKRLCQVIELKKEFEQEYKRIHSNVWPTVISTLQRSHIVDYSINFLPVPKYPSTNPEIAGLLVATFKYVGDDFEGDKKIGEDEETRKWWKLTDPMQRSLIDGATGSADGPWWLDIEEVFRLD
ncbi:hypothetical protein FRC02_003900 [Tulasnella sp. 418]|nr:hypothetical protein FRC02_003900 [Tulasnella sp. 418]